MKLIIAYHPKDGKIEEISIIPTTDFPPKARLLVITDPDYSVDDEWGVVPIEVSWEGFTLKLLKWLSKNFEKTDRPKCLKSFLEEVLLGDNAQQIQRQESKV